MDCHIVFLPFSSLLLCLHPPLSPPPTLPVDTLVYKVQNMQWTADFSGAITLTWTSSKRMPPENCDFIIYYRSALHPTVGPTQIRLLRGQHSSFGKKLAEIASTK